MASAEVRVEDDLSKNTQKYQHHVPYSVGYYVKCSYDDSLSFYKSYTGQDSMQWFVKELQDFAEMVETVFLCPFDIDMSKEEEEEFQKATHCHICEKPFKENDKKVRDHNHLVPNNNYRGAAHSSPCNINLQDEHTISVVFHNMSSYDGHLAIRALAEVEGKIDILPVNKEKYISFTKHIPGNLVNFRFIDSLRFMDSGLDKLASYLQDYPILRSEFKDLSEDKFSLLKRKGVFPYDFMDDWQKLNEPKLPMKAHFYNILTDSIISEKQYKHAEKVWNIFGCKTMKDYSELYMKTDILLLADVFEQFRCTSIKTYGLDPAHSFTLPGYTWQCMLYKTAQKLELLTDLEMVMFIEKGIRGGLSQCSRRYAEANNKYIPTYNPEKDESYLMYFDINNQYGWAMSQYLPYGGFNWLSADELNCFDARKVPDDANTGFILEVDLEIPIELHDKFSDLPPCPEHGTPRASKNKKLLATLYNKTEYVIHYRNLKQALDLGVKLTKVHRVVSFKQSPWLKQYIDLNTKLRQAAKNEFEKNLFKLMNNAVFGKTMENVRNHSSVKIVTNWDGRYGAEALISRPEFKSSNIINENLVIIELTKSEVFFNKPIYAGMCILDLAKTTIYNFHYGYMLNTFPDCSVLYTDTDSLIYEIKNTDVYNVMKNDCDLHFDTSDYNPDNVYKIPLVNKKVLGMMKDENNGRIMTHFIGLRSKMYAVKSYYTQAEIEAERLKLENDAEERSEIDLALRNLSVTKKIKGFSADKMFGPLTFEDLKYDVQFLDSETKCLLCEDSFNIRLRLDIFLSHIFDVHQCVIEDAQNIKNLPEYILYWRDRFKKDPIEQIIPSVKVEVTGEQYFLFSSLLKEDEKLRHKLNLDFVMKVHEFERTDSSFIRQCLFCKLQYEGSRQGYLEHLAEQHNLQLGNPQNLVFIEDLINQVDQQIQNLTCIFCKGIFPERNVLKEHMRKKIHKRINPADSGYDRFYIVNYLEVGKSWQAIEKEDDRYALPRGEQENCDQEYSDWNEKEDQITCLFCSQTETDINLLCLHMDGEHHFDFVKSTESLDYYQKIKLVNYIRKMTHNNKCLYCEACLENKDSLCGHMREMEHCIIPKTDMFDQPEFYFPTYENDAFLYLIDDVED